MKSSEGFAGMHTAHTLGSAGEVVARNGFAWATRLSTGGSGKRTVTFFPEAATNLERTLKEGGSMKLGTALRA